ncbi:MAG TPA: hypothetical protein PKW08_05195 [Flavobacteriaceae bacterium]|nr:hypothetical protein [Flavobacteriaceae bacterium]MCB9214030.1 hypothetical protein [Alteromonas sp.]HPF10825.1 hypothetical protein [Flavobacteriaceae bacterium]HQU20966.1 hypothetical protein [Flavobacteriaceae bacterium]HQU65545.1 hypothetical protein [Flavobacteriaceae bacterium]
MGSGLQLMRITGYSDEEFQVPFKGKPYVVMMNPESIKWQRSVEYNDKQAPDTSAPSQKYKSTPSDKLNFEIVIDCTGLVNNKRTDMSAEIEALENIVYTYQGKIHRPNFVKIQWGKNMLFKGVLVSMDISYTYFRPDGSPLRAKVSLGFSQYISPSTLEKLDQKESPDVSHLVNVADGESLPQLCKRIWDDETYYVQVAKFNGLNKFRHLKGGTQLIFPPLIPIS